MAIIRKYFDEETWEIVGLEVAIKKTEGCGYYKPGTVKDMLQNGDELKTPWAVYKSTNVYYYTFGTDPAFPYCGGWVEVYADSWEEAHEKFRAKFPDRHKGIINCAFFYDQEKWKQMSIAFGNLGEFCHEVII